MNKVLQQFQPCRLAFFRVELHPKKITPRNGAHKGRRIIAGRLNQGGVTRLDVIAVYKIKTRILSDIAPQGMISCMMHLIPAHMRHLEPVAPCVLHVTGKTRHLALFSNSICMPMQIPRKGLVFAACTTTLRKLRESSSRMQSGIAPCPGNTTRSARSITPASSVTTMSRSGATWRKACSTERRLPMP
jgi:hypothetical protein